MRIIFLLAAIIINTNIYAAIIEKNGNFYQAVNTHLFSISKCRSQTSTLKVCTDRDLTLIPVKKPSNPIFSVKNPSFLQKNRKITLKIDGKIISGNVVAVSQGFFEINIPFKRGDSGIAVFDAETKRIAGLLSHYVTAKRSKHFFAVRLDDLEHAEFESLTAAELNDDITAFKKYKQQEAAVIAALIKSSDGRKLKTALKNAISSLNYTAWKSTYLKNEAEKSKNNINEIYRRIIK